MASHQCVILAGGYGSRLGKITKKVPKPLIKINNKPFILYLIKNLYRQGVRDFIVLTYYKNSFFKKKKLEFFKDAKIKLVNEKKKLGTLGSIINAKRYLKKSFFVVNGDTYFDFNIRDLEFNLNKFNKDIGVALTKIESKLPKISYKLKKNKFNKVFLSTKKTKYICGGTYYFNKKILKNFKIKNLDIDNDLIIKKKYSNSIFTKYYSNNFLDIGTFQDLKKSSLFFKSNIYKPCAFLDKDGVFNEDSGYVHTVKKTKWKKNIFTAIKLLNDNNYRVIIITNQAGIAKGYFSLKKFLKYRDWFHYEFLLRGSFIDETYFCPFHPDSKFKRFKRKSNLRKPGNDMILEAFKDWEINKSKSFLIGDKSIDISAGRKSKIRSLLVKKDIYNQVKKLIK